jgi:aspartokinase-like uncharacterized kinase
MSVRQVIKIVDGAFYIAPDAACFYGDTYEIFLKSHDKYGESASLNSETLKCWISYQSDNSLLLELTEADGISVHGDSATITIDTSELPAFGDYKFQIWHTDFIICQGNLTINEAIT